MAKRIQLSRKKGYRKPADAVNVARPTKWGNPFKAEYIEVWDCSVRKHRKVWAACAKPGTVWWTTSESDWVGYWHENKTDAVNEAIKLYEEYITGSGLDLNELREKDLACWCKLDEPCHADVLLRLANKQMVANC